ncbi:MAG TPA: glycosyltransferase family 39 protein [Acidobacteriaceae bacterium]|nr:glycosyltransferase family 39 protein [Acidobacteriaceae bacterium]
MRRPSIPVFTAHSLTTNPQLRAIVAEPSPARPVLYVESTPRASPHPEPWSRRSVLVLLALWAAMFLAAAATPSLLDDADATHSQAAQAMLHTGDWVTLHVNGIRYLEKPPLPYWIAASSLRIFGENTFAIHLPLALTVLGLALLAYAWGRRAFSERAGFYAALFTLTSVGVFLFTRIFIPDALLSLLLALSIYAALRALDIHAQRPRLWAFLMWSTLACAVLTKGLVAIVFLFASVGLFLILTGEWRRWRLLHPFTGLALFLAIAAPWHILAALRNPAVPMPAGSGFPSHAGWTWFYLYNEHIARFLGTRVPRDYNKLPAALYWLLHIVWLFPWSLFAPAAIAVAWRERGSPSARWLGLERHRLRESRWHSFPRRSFAARTILLLTIFSAIILAFFSLSTNQEYYTFPVYLPLLLLTAAALAHLESEPLTSTRTPGSLTFAHAALTVLGLIIASALTYGLWTSRHLAFVPDIGSLLAHRGVGDYTLSMSHFFDLTGPSFAALRLPAALAAIAFAIGPLAAWILRARRHAFASTLTIALTAATFLIAAHIALVRFAPMLSSRDFASTIQNLEGSHAIAPDSQVFLYGDQAYGSSIPFYLGQHVQLVDGRSTSMLFGSLFPDAPHIFLTPADLLAQWGRGPRKILFVPLEKRDIVDHLLGPHQILLKETSGKALLTDRPLDHPSGQ